tara:strand:+ start:277 stop:558 length:282 start_codon:yes stop_codon:yes gene_type:complete
MGELGHAAIHALKPAAPAPGKMGRTQWLHHRYRQGVTIAELAKEFGLKESTVRMRVNDFTNREHPEELTDKQRAFVDNPEAVPVHIQHKRRFV